MVGSSPSGLTITGDGTGIVTLVGSQSEINLALEGLRYTPNAQFAGESTIQIVTDDLGHNGSGASLIDTDVVNMNVNLFVWPFGGTSYWVVHMEGGFYAAQDRNEWIYGTSFDDIISLPNGTHSYIIDAESGNDGVICYSTQYTYLMGGDGADWISLMCGNAEISGTAASGWYTGESGMDAYWSEFETIYVSGLPDCNITINAGCEVYWIEGSSGSDTIVNNGTVGHINTYAGNDIINMFGNFNDCSVYGGNGDDDIYIYLDCYSAYISGSGNEGSAEYIANILSPSNVVNWYGFERVHVMGSDGQDNFTMGAGATVYEIQGMAGDDTIYNYGTVTAAYGGSGNDNIRNMGTVTDAIHGGDGADFILNWAGASAESILGEAGSDHIGNSGIVQRILADSWSTSDINQNDTINLWSGSGTYSVMGSAGYNTIYIESGATVDRLGGENGTFSITNAGTVSTFIWTGDGNDTINLSPGSTINAVWTGRGNDTVTNQGTVTAGIITGLGNDTVNLYDDCTSPYYGVDCGDDSDSLHIYGQNIVLSYQIDNYDYPLEPTGVVTLQSVIISLDGIENIYVEGTSDNDVIEVYSEFVREVRGWGGDDTITIRSANSSAKIYGDDGNDLITNRAALSELYGGDGNDTIINYGSVTLISGDAGADNITNHGRSTYLLISGGAGNDIISNDGIFYLIYGDADDDVVYWSDGTGYVYGGTGIDTIYLPSGSIKTGGPGNGTATFSDYMIAIREFELWV